MTCIKSLVEDLLVKHVSNMKKKDQIFINIPQPTTLPVVEKKLTKLDDLSKSIRIYIEVK